MNSIIINDVDGNGRGAIIQPQGLSLLVNDEIRYYGIVVSDNTKYEVVPLKCMNGIWVCDYDEMATVEDIEDVLGLSNDSCNDLVKINKIIIEKTDGIITICNAGCEERLS